MAAFILDSDREIKVCMIKIWDSWRLENISIDEPSRGNPADLLAVSGNKAQQSWISHLLVNKVTVTYYLYICAILLTTHRLNEYRVFDEYTLVDWIAFDPTCLALRYVFRRLRICMKFWASLSSERFRNFKEPEFGLGKPKEVASEAQSIEKDGANLLWILETGCTYVGLVQASIMSSMR